MSRLRLLHITEAYPPDYGGGVAIYVQDICRALAARGHDVRVLGVENTPEREAYTLREDTDGPVRLTRINLPHILQRDPEAWFLGLAGWTRHQQRLAEIQRLQLAAWRPHLVHAHFAPMLGEEFFLHAKEEAGLPLVWTLHDAWIVCLRHQLIRSPLGTICSGPGLARCFECVYSNFDGSHAKAIAKVPWRVLRQGLLPWRRLLHRRRLARAADAVHGYSRFMAEALRPHVDGLVEHIPLGIWLDDTGTPRPVRPRSPLRFGFLAGFPPHKGLRQVLDAMRDLRERGLEWELYVWGPGCDAGVEEVRSRGLEDRVQIRGMFAPGQQVQALPEFDVLIMATLTQEPFGRVVGEAALFGVPTLAPDVGGITEQIRDGVDGLLYRFRDSDALRDRLAALIRSPDLVRHLCKNLRRPLDTRDAVIGLEDLYGRVLQASRDAKEGAGAV
jgi:glycosyltransferase involved in cell wall biosynthesis